MTIYSIRYKRCTPGKSIISVGVRKETGTQKDMEISYADFLALVRKGEVIDATLYKDTVYSVTLDKCKIYTETVDALSNADFHKYSDKFEVFLGQNAIWHITRWFEAQHIYLPSYVMPVKGETMSIVGLSKTGKTSALYSTLYHWHEKTNSGVVELSTKFLKFALIKIKGDISYTELRDALSSLSPNIDCFFFDDVTKCLVKKPEDTVKALYSLNKSSSGFVVATGIPNEALISESDKTVLVETLPFVQYEAHCKKCRTTKAASYPTNYGYAFLSQERINTKLYFKDTIMQFAEQASLNTGVPLKYFILNACITLAYAAIDSLKFENATYRGEEKGKLANSLAIALAQELDKSVVVTDLAHMYFGRASRLSTYMSGILICQVLNRDKTADKQLSYSFCIRNNAICHYVLHTLNRLNLGIDTEALELRNLAWSNQIGAETNLRILCYAKADTHNAFTYTEGYPLVDMHIDTWKCQEDFHVGKKKDVKDHPNIRVISSYDDLYFACRLLGG